MAHVARQRLFASAGAIRAVIAVLTVFARTALLALLFIGSSALQQARAAQGPMRNLGPTPIVQAAPTTLFEELSRARDVICAFNRSGPVQLPAPLQRNGGDMMLVIEGLGVDRDTASVTSSRGIGAKPARVYASETGVHVVEDVNGSVIVTTVLACESWKGRTSGGKCRRYSAVIAWHFDRSVHLNPDKSFLGLPGSSYTGHCEPWNLE